MTTDAALIAYRAHDARVSIGMPIKQDNGEYEYPGFIDNTLIAFYPNIRLARLALDNILVAGAWQPDVEYAPCGWAD